MKPTVGEKKSSDKKNVRPKHRLDSSLQYPPEASTGRKVRRLECSWPAGRGSDSAVPVGADAEADGSMISMLPPDLFMEHVISMLPKYDRFLAPVCQSFRDACMLGNGGKMETNVYEMSSVHQMEIYLMERNEGNDKLHCFPSEIAKRFVSAGTGQRDLLEWTGVDDSYSCDGAARGGRLETLMWLREGGCRWDEYTCTHAAGGGKLEVLRWARANGCPWNSDTCTQAAQGGKLEVLRWARENGCPWDELTCQAAAREGRLEILKWARENGCPWNSDTCACATRGGKLEALKWARENGCPWNRNECEEIARQQGHIHIVAWIRENRKVSEASDNEED